MSHYNSYQTISVSFVCVGVRLCICLYVPAVAVVDLFTLMLILDCLCRGFFSPSFSLFFLEIAVISSVGLALPVTAAGGQWAPGYNCIALPSHSVATPICLFNIQLSTLDLEASMTAQSRIHTNTPMADFSRGRLK